VCPYVCFVSLSITLCLFPRDSSRQLLVIYLQHGPKGAHRAHRHLVFPRARDLSDVRCSEYATTRRSLLIDIVDFFFSLSLSLYLSLSSIYLSIYLTYFTDHTYLLTLSSSFLSILHFIFGSHGKPVARGHRRQSLSNFRILREILFVLCALPSHNTEVSSNIVATLLQCYCNTAGMVYAVKVMYKKDLGTNICDTYNTTNQPRHSLYLIYMIT